MHGPSNVKLASITSLYYTLIKKLSLSYFLYYAVVTQHIKQLQYYNWLHSATCFGRYPAIIRPTKNSVKVHSLALPMEFFKLKGFNVNNGIPLEKLMNVP